MPRTKARATPLALVAALAVMAGCTEDAGGTASPASPSVSATPSLTPAVARELVQRGVVAPTYSARITIDSWVDGGVSISMEGKVNLNGPLTGRLRVNWHDVPARRFDVVMTGKEIWARDVDAKSRWKRTTPWEVGMNNKVSTYGRYGQALLDVGDDVLKGRERTESGVEAVRLSGSIPADAVRSIEPELYDTMRSLGLDAVETDVWLDDEGRVVKLEQWLRAEESEVHNVVLFGEFGAAFAQPPPKGQGAAKPEPEPSEDTETV